MKFVHAAWRPLAILLFVTSLALVVKLPLDAFSSGYDPYYHAAHAKAFLAGSEFSYPVLTYFSDYPADPWFGYHALLGWTQLILSDFGYNDIAGSMILHALFSGILFATLYCFYLVLYRFIIPLYEDELEKRGARAFVSKLSAETMSLITIAVTLLIAQSFIFRAIIIERPHLLMITLTLLLTIGVLTKRTWLVFLSAAIAPLVYSLPIFLGLPFAAFILGWLLVSKRLTDLKELIKPTIAVALGLASGVALHPDSLGYLVNGVGFHAFAIFQSAFGFLPFLDMRLVVPAEMSFTEEFPGVFFILFFTVILAQCYNRNLEQKAGTLSKSNLRVRIYEVGFGRLAAFLIAASFLINRITEYAIPLAMFVFVSYGMLILYPLGKYHLDRLSTHNQNLAQQVADVSIRLRKIKQNPFAKVFLGIFILYALLGHGLNIRESAFRHRLEPDRFAGAASYLAEHSEETDVALLAQFGYYPQLAYHQPSIRASVGMDDRMVFFKDRELAHEINRFRGFTTECQTTACETTDTTTIPEFMSEHHISHVVVDADLFNEKSLGRMESYEFLEMVYTDERYPDVRVYEVIYEPS